MHVSQTREMHHNVGGAIAHAETISQQRVLKASAPLDGLSLAALHRLLNGGEITLTVNFISSFSFEMSEGNHDRAGVHEIFVD